MASTYTPIATTTLGSAQTTVTFSSIPSTYTDLVLIAFLQDANYYALMRFNSDSGTNYSRTYMGGNGSSAFSGRGTSLSSIPVGADPNTSFAITRINIMNYSNSTTYKSLVLRQDSPTDGYLFSTAGLWRNTAAINRIDITSASGGASMLAGSTFTLYGIKAA